MTNYEIIKFRAIVQRWLKISLSYSKKEAESLKTRKQKKSELHFYLLFFYVPTSPDYTLGYSSCGLWEMRVIA